MDIMLDLETMGTSKNAAILQIGVVAFDKAAKKISTGGKLININLQSSLLFGFSIDTTTLKWWKTQSPEAKLALSASGDYHSVPEGLQALSQFVREVQPERVWAHGPSFDIALLENAYEVVQQEVPWVYNAPRDTRTLFDLAKEAGWERPERDEVLTEHDGLMDAIYQAACVQDAYSTLWGA